MINWVIDEDSTSGWSEDLELLFFGYDGIVDQWNKSGKLIAKFRVKRHTPGQASEVRESL
jgi:hypothetical protein